MQFERITDNQVKITFTFEELNEWGLMKGEEWKDSHQWHDALFHMLDDLEEQIGFHFCGDMTIEIFSLQTNGMVFIVTLDDHDEWFFDDEVFPLDFWKGTPFEDLLFMFQDIEDVIQLAHVLFAKSYRGGSLFKMGESYYLYMNRISKMEKDSLVAIMSEFGNPSSKSIHVLLEYGRLIIKDEAVGVLTRHFQKPGNS